jgi:CheY-like chemotaxis protein
VLLFESVRELLLNVTKHSGVKEAEVRLAQTEDNRLQVTVSDRGKGFDAERASHGRDDGGGFGLLSIRERIGLIGGRFEIDSSPGNGARFSLIAPLRSDDKDRAASVPQREEAALSLVHLRLQPSGKIRVMLVDDHAVMREGLARLLSQEPDFEVIGQASDGQEAVEKAEALLPEVLLMDISMPRMNGIDATRIIRQRHPSIQIIGLSLYQEEERAREMLDAGASFYLTKSGPPADLKAAIRSCMENLNDSCH